MLELVAQGPELRQRLRSILRTGERPLLGRDPEVAITIPWDPLISRRHVQLVVHDETVDVQRLAGTVNPLFFDGETVDQCVMKAGTHFVLGSTTFRLEVTGQEAAQTPVEEHAFDPSQLAQVRYQDPENRLAVLTNLPHVIAGAQSDVELNERLCLLLLKGVVHADAVAIVHLTGADSVGIRHAERRSRTGVDVRPSRRLVFEALEKHRHSVLYVWNANESNETQPTLAAEFDWAFCTPVDGLGDAPTGLYITGRMGQTFVPGMTLSEGAQLEADVKFTELVAEIIAAVVKSRRLERQKAGLRQFFAPPILAALGDNLDTTLLEPTECDVAVLFCDLRGFSQRAEREGDNLIGLLDRVSRALGVMTQQILLHGGVTGDFQGDAALGFWGWPFPSPDAVVQAGAAALGIRAAFERAAAQKDHPLADFSMGIGIAYGRAVAGKIGTEEQVKVTVFGPVVNLAHRLESMTKLLRAPILLDEAAAKIVRARMPITQGRLRKLARVLPYGLETPVVVSELLPSAADDPSLTDAHLRQFEAGVEHFTDGRWEEAFRSLHNMPATDRAQDFLLHHIMQHSRQAPPNWDGIVRLPNK
ncbi:MAG TPA: adenylate/guanylate cyclase domain-containing protein [Planctomycetaceae bacterium]|nr:adenylate/guanylate cyclase domain-containing protein [Planctomycetaceae bacterium]